MPTAFATIEDVHRWVQTPIEPDTTPSDTDAQAFLDDRAAQLIVLCNRFGVTVDPNNPTTFAQPPGLARMLNTANCMGAALDFTMAQVFGLAPAHTERLTFFAARWRDLTGLWDGITSKQNLGDVAVGTIEILLRGGLARFAPDADDVPVEPSFPIKMEDKH